MPTTAKAIKPAIKAHVAAGPPDDFRALGSGMSNLKRSAIVAPPPAGDTDAAGEPVGLTFTVFLIVIAELYH